VSEHSVALAWRRLFLRDDDVLSPDAEIVLQDLKARCGWDTVSLPRNDYGMVDPLATAATVERRGVYSHVKTRLFGPMPKETATNDRRNRAPR